MKEKIKIMHREPQVTDDEIRSFMDFDSLLRQRDLALHRKHVTRNIRVFTTVALAVLITAAIFFFPRIQRAGEEIPAEPSSPSHRHPAADSARSEKSAVPVPGQDKPTPAKPETTTPKREKTAVNPESETPPPPIPVYVQAEPVDGYPALYSYFDKNFVYPQDAIADSVAGTLNVSFVIDTTGKPADITVADAPSASFGQEAIRLVREMPAWRPATYNGKPVSSKLSLPITFGVKKVSN